MVYDVSCSNGIQSFWYYFAHGVAIGIIYPIICFLDKEGWNSWRKIKDLFKKSK